MKNKVLFFMFFGTSLLMINAGCKKKGCTNPDATNFNSKAKKDDGSCILPNPNVATLSITSDITSPRTITNQTVSVCGNIRVTSTLTLGQGAVLIMCANSNIIVDPSGSLNSTGTAASPVIIRGTSPTPGSWGAVAFTSNNPNNKLIYTTISDGGGNSSWDNAIVNIYDGAQVTIQNSSINRSQQNGLFAYSGTSLPGFASNTFSNNGTYGVRIFASQIKFLDAASNYNVSNGEGYIFADDDNINNSHTWLNLNTPYLLNGTIEVNGNLTIQPGANIRMEAQSALRILATGSMNASGSSASAINIRGKVATPGFWQGVSVQSNNTNNIYRYVNISDGGFGSYNDYATINVYNGGTLRLDNSNVSNSNSYGVYVYNDCALYTNNSQQTTDAGVLANNSIFGNGIGGNANCTNGCTVYFQP